MAQGELSGATLLEDLVEATVQGLDCYDRVVVAHLFSVLPKVGITEDAVSEHLVRRLADRARAVGAVIEVNEKWTCPSTRVVRILADRGVRLAMSTDAHQAWMWVRTTTCSASTPSSPRPEPCTRRHDLHVMSEAARQASGS